MNKDGWSIVERGGDELGERWLGRHRGPEGCQGTVAAQEEAWPGGLHGERRRRMIPSFRFCTEPPRREMLCEGRGLCVKRQIAQRWARTLTSQRKWLSNLWQTPTTCNDKRNRGLQNSTLQKVSNRCHVKLYPSSPAHRKISSSTSWRGRWALRAGATGRETSGRWS